MDQELIEQIWGDNAAPENWRVILIAFPTRALRVIASADNLLFRVEQLRRKIDKSVEWVVISSHKGDTEFESFGVAVNDMWAKQARLREKQKLAEHERKMAMIKAQQATEATQ